MVHEEPTCGDTARFSTTDAANLLGIHRNTLRLHTKAGHIKCGYNRVNRRPFYLGREIRRYWRAYA